MRGVLERLREHAHLAGVFVISAEGRLLRSSASADLPVERLAQTALAKLQTAEGIERQLEPTECGVVFSGVSNVDVHASWLRTDLALGLCFDRRITSLGAVRLRLAQFRDELGSDPELA